MSLVELQEKFERRKESVSPDYYMNLFHDICQDDDPSPTDGDGDQSSSGPR